MSAAEKTALGIAMVALAEIRDMPYQAEASDLANEALKRMQDALQRSEINQKFEAMEGRR